MSVRAPLDPFDRVLGGQGNQFAARQRHHQRVDSVDLIKDFAAVRLNDFDPFLNRNVCH